ncbi:MAG: hypothetical protein AM325_011850, partial [Candidatus Thorarchaeota archaeon SMTZ1-45]
MKRNLIIPVVIFIVLSFCTLCTTIDSNELEILSINQQIFTVSGVGDDIEDYVDQLSNMHTPTDKGTHSSFVNLQSFDAAMDTLTELDVGDPTINEYLYVDGFSGTHQWGLTGTSPYLDAVDGSSYISTNTDGFIDEWYTFTDTTGNSGAFSVNASVYFISTDGNDDYYWEIDWTDDGVADASGTVANPGSAAWSDLGVISGLDTPAEVNAARLSIQYSAQGGAGIMSVDAARLGVYHLGTGNDFELDLEVGWTAADFDELNEYLCIYAGTQDSEALMVDVWNGASWANVIADLVANQWNNVSVSSYLTSSSFEIRFIDANQANEGTLDTWNVDAVLLHTWTPSYIPANDQAPTLDNPSDTDNMYAQYLEYEVTVYVSDQNGFADIDYLEIGLWDDTQTTEYCRFRYDEDTNAFTEEYDAGTYVTLNTGSSTATESGNDIDATFYITVDWDFPDSTDLDARCYVIDTQTESATTWYEVNWDVETRLDFSVAPSIDDGSGTVDRGDLDGSFSLTGTIIYYTSTDDYPSSTAVDVWVAASEYGTTAGPWSDLTLTSGAFDVTCYADDVVGQDTYTIKVVEEGAGAGGT